MEIRHKDSSKDNDVKFFLSGNSLLFEELGEVSSCYGLEGDEEESQDHEVFDSGEASYKKFLTVDNDIDNMLTALPYQSFVQDMSEDIRSKFVTSSQKKSSTFSCLLRKKLLSPIIERRKRSAQLETASYTCKDGQIETKTDEDIKAERDPISTDANVLPGSQTPYIGQMMKSLLLQSKTDEKEFKALDPLDIERKIISTPKLASSEYYKKSKSCASALGKVKAKFGFFKNAASGQKRAYSDSTYPSTDDVMLELSTDGSYGSESSIFDDVCFTQGLDQGGLRQDNRIRRISSSDILPRRQTKTGLIPFFDVFRDKKVEYPFQKKSSSKPELPCRYDSGIRKLIRESSDPVIQRSGKVTPKLSRESSTDSPCGSKKGTLLLSRDSSLSSPFGSKNGTPVLSRGSSFASPNGSKRTPKSGKRSDSASPYGSKKGTPKMSRESSLASPLTAKAEYSSLSQTKKATAKSVRENNQDSSMCSKKPAQAAESSHKLRTKKMSKVKSLPQIETKKGLHTPKLKRRLSTPRIRRHTEIINQEKTVSSPKVNRQKLTKSEFLSNSTLKETGTRKNGQSSGAKVFDGAYRGHTKYTEGTRSKTNAERQDSTRKSQIDVYQISQADRVEKWLETISVVGVFFDIISFIRVVGKLTIFLVTSR